MLKRINKIKYLIDTITVDPGYNTGIAIWDDDPFPETVVLHADTAKSVINRIEYLYNGFKDLIDRYLNIKFVIIEGVNLWVASGKSQSSAAQGYLFDLAYLVGVYSAICFDKGITVKIVTVNQWKGQMPAKVVKNRIKLINNIEYPEHIQEAVGIGFSEIGIL